MNEKGFTLPITILLLFLIVALVAAQLAGTQALIKSLRVESNRVQMFHAADGMIEYGLAVMPDTLSIGDSVTVTDHAFASNFVGNMSMVRTDTDTMGIEKHYTLYGFSRLSTIDSAKVKLELVVRGAPLWNVPAGFIAVGGFTRNGQSGIISGADACGDDVPGIFAPDSSVTDNQGVVDGNEPWIEGNPAVEWSNDMESDLGFDQWDYLRNELVADYEVWSLSDWPTDFTHWPTIRIMNPFLMLDDNFNGRGTIIANDGLRLGGGMTWEGIILVGDDVTINGNANLMGSIATGLNELLGMPTTPMDLGNGTMNLIYNSCSVDAALMYVNPVRKPGDWSIIR